jgi:D-aminopeptidase
MQTRYWLIIIFLSLTQTSYSQLNMERKRTRDLGLITGDMQTGHLNAITDVQGVTVGHKTLIRGDSIRTGVTAILPHSMNIYHEKVPGAIVVFNGYGKLAGFTQVEELGNIETPIILTNTLSVPTAANALIKYTLRQPANESVRSVNPIVGETNDGYLNDIRGMHVTEQDVMDAIKSADAGIVEEGCVGAGTGTTALGFKGGIGTASRVTPEMNGLTYTVGVLVQTNFGRDLVLNGTKVPRESVLAAHKKGDGSCMIIIATDAPLDVRNLKRLAKRSFTGMGRTTTYMSNGSGDYAIAFSTAYTIPHQSQTRTNIIPALLSNDAMTILFKAVEEATQEAIYNSLFMATPTKGFHGHQMDALPIERVMGLMKTN